MKLLVLPSQYPDDADPINAVFVREDALAAAAHAAVTVVWICAVSVADVRLRAPVRREAGGVITTWRIYVPKQLYPLVAPVVAAVFAARADLIHAHAALPAGVLGAVVGSALRKPLVISEYMNPFAAQLGNPLRRILVRSALARATEILVDSRYSQAQLEEAGIRGFFRVAPNAADANLFSPPEGRRKNGPTRLLYVGRLATEKNPLAAIDALAVLRRSATLTIVGDGPLLVECIEQIERLELGDRVQLLGMRSSVEVADQMRQADVLLAPSVDDNQPAAIVEALVSGLPVVTTNAGGIPELVGAGDGLITDPNPAALAAAVDGLAELPADRQAIAARARARHSREAVGRLLADVYAAATGR